MSSKTKNRAPGLWTVWVFSALLLEGALLPARSAYADLRWRDHYSDEDVVGNGDVLTGADGVSVTVGTSVYSDSDGGTFDLSPYGNSDYFTYETDRLGNQRRHLEIGFDNQNNDPADYAELTLTFDSAVRDLNFTLLDIDSGTWDDGVEVYYNGSNNARDNGAIDVTTGAYNGIDNETYMHGWEGFGSNATSNEVFGNIDFDFGSIEITSIRIRYFSTDDASSNPGGQIAGLSNLVYTKAVPEAHAVGCCVAFVLVIGLSRLRKRMPPPSPQSAGVDQTCRVEAEVQPTRPVLPRSPTREQRSLQSAA